MPFIILHEPNSLDSAAIIIARNNKKEKEISALNIHFFHDSSIQEH